MLMLLSFCCYRVVVVAGDLKSLHLQEPGFLLFENKARSKDGQTAGRSDRPTDQRTRILKMRSRI